MIFNDFIKEFNAGKKLLMNTSRVLGNKRKSLWEHLKSKNTSILDFKDLLKKKFFSSSLCLRNRISI